MAQDNFKWPGVSADEVKATAAIKWDELQGHLASMDGWATFSDADAVKGYSKLFPYCPISCYKLEGLIDAAPAVAAEYLEKLTPTDLKRHDPNVLTHDVIGNPLPNCIVVRQNNSLPWPIWNRQTIYVRFRRDEPDGSVWFLAWGARDPKNPVDVNNLVESKLHVATWGFVPDKASGKTKMIRLLHVDPAGNLPAWVVEANVSSLPLCIKDVRARAK